MRTRLFMWFMRRRIVTWFVLRRELRPREYCGKAARWWHRDQPYGPKP